MFEKHHKLNITLPESILNELSLVAKELNDKKSRIIAKALSLYFDEIDTQIAEKRYREYEKGKTKSYTLAEVETELGL